jgi:hypothetical protein
MEETPMARVYLLSQPTPLLNYLYVVDRAVGQGCANARDDVLLVQFFLRVLLQPKGSYANQEVFQPAGEQPLGIDGICGKHTVTYIKAFQTQFNETQPAHVRSTKWGLLEDGTINALEGGSVYGKRFHRLMTLLRLNTQYSGMFSLDQHKHIDRHPLFPRELFGSLFLAPPG